MEDTEAMTKAFEDAHRLYGPWEEGSESDHVAVAILAVALFRSRTEQKVVQV